MTTPDAGRELLSLSLPPLVTRRQTSHPMPESRVHPLDLGNGSMTHPISGILRAMPLAAAQQARRTHTSASEHQGHMAYAPHTSLQAPPMGSAPPPLPPQTMMPMMPLDGSHSTRQADGTAPMSAAPSHASVSVSKGVVPLALSELVVNCQIDMTGIGDRLTADKFHPRRRDDANNDSTAFVNDTVAAAAAHTSVAGSTAASADDARLLGALETASMHELVALAQASPRPRPDVNSIQPTTCEQCHRVFPRAAFNAHVSQSHTRHRPEYQCRFPACGQWFGRRDLTAAHEATCAYQLTRVHSSHAASAAATMTTAAPMRKRKDLHHDREDDAASTRVVRAMHAHTQTSKHTGMVRYQDVAMSAEYAASPRAPLSAAAAPSQTVPASSHQFHASSGHSHSSSTHAATTAAVAGPAPHHLSPPPQSQSSSSRLRQLEKENSDMKAVLYPAGYPQLHSRVLHEIELFLLGLITDVRREKVRRESCLGARCQQRVASGISATAHARSMACFPCSHVCLCEDCAQMTLHCPVCNKAVRHVMRVILADAGPVSRPSSSAAGAAAAVGVATRPTMHTAVAEAMLQSRAATQHAHLMRAQIPLRRRPSSVGNDHSVPKGPRETIEVTSDDESDATAMPTQRSSCAATVASSHAREFRRPVDATLASSASSPCIMRIEGTQDVSPSPLPPTPPPHPIAQMTGTADTSQSAMACDDAKCNPAVDATVAQSRVTVVDAAVRSSALDSSVSSPTGESFQVHVTPPTPTTTVAAPTTQPLWSVHGAHLPMASSAHPPPIAPLASDAPPPIPSHSVAASRPQETALADANGQSTPTAVMSDAHAHDCDGERE